jgi:hypothetical protein
MTGKATENFFRSLRYICLFRKSCGNTLADVYRERNGPFLQGSAPSPFLARSRKVEPKKGPAKFLHPLLGRSQGVPPKKGKLIRQGIIDIASGILTVIALFPSASVAAPRFPKGTHWPCIHPFLLGTPAFPIQTSPGRTTVNKPRP